MRTWYHASEQARRSLPFALVAMARAAGGVRSESPQAPHFPEPTRRVATGVSAIGDIPQARRRLGRSIVLRPSERDKACRSRSLPLYC